MVPSIVRSGQRRATIEKYLQNFVVVLVCSQNQRCYVGGEVGGGSVDSLPALQEIIHRNQSVIISLTGGCHLGRMKILGFVQQFFSFK